MAAEYAVEATKQFFENLRATVGDKIFARFLNLQAVRTLALVIDDTGSMGGRANESVLCSSTSVKVKINRNPNLMGAYIRAQPSVLA